VPLTPLLPPGCKAIRCCPGARSLRKPIPHPRSLPPVPNGASPGLVRASLRFLTPAAAAFPGRCPRPLSSGNSRCSERQLPAPSPAACRWLAMPASVDRI